MPRTPAGWKVRAVAYLLLALVAGAATPSADVISMLPVFLVGVVVFEVGFFAYRRWRGGR